MGKSISLQPEFEIVDGGLSSLRYLEHGAESDLIRWHCHAEYELHMITSTQGKAFIGDYIGGFRPGYIYLVGPHLPHNWVSNDLMDEEIKQEPDGRIRDKVINFSQNSFDLLYKAVPESRELSGLLEKASYGLEFYDCDLKKYESLFNEVRDRKGVQKLVSFFTLMDLLSNDENCRRLSSRKFLLGDQLQNSDIINKALNYIGKNYTSSLSLDELSKHVGMTSSSSFSRFFHKATGVKYIDFVKKIRISKACEKLEVTNEPITSICYAVGFSNVANFNRHFMSMKGMTPRKYRAWSQKKYS